MTYPIGKPGTPWNEDEKQQWFNKQTIKRLFKDQVLSEIKHLASQYDEQLVLEQYGALPINPVRYPLYLFKSKNWQPDKETVLVTGGVHGYETSGVHGALAFITTLVENYLHDFNFVVVPCVSPWGYETINRWNPAAIDPNRSFYANSPAPESAQLMAWVTSLDKAPICHIDLHETTDTDNSEFRPALAARDAIEQKSWNIPDGFYGVGDTARPEPEFQAAIIKRVEQVTHIAPADENQQLIGSDMTQYGVINYDCKGLGLCAGLTDAKYVSTTEVYPDSDLVDDKNCIDAQVAAIVGAIEYIKDQA